MLRLFTSKNTFFNPQPTLKRAKQSQNAEEHRWVNYSCLKARDYRELFKDDQKRNEIFFKMLEIPKNTIWYFAESLRIQNTSTS